MAWLFPNALHYTLTEDGLSVGPVVERPAHGIDLGKLTADITISIKHDSFVQGLIALPVHTLDLERILPLCHVVDARDKKKERERPKLMGIPLPLWPREHMVAILEQQYGPERDAALQWYDANTHLVEP